MNDFRQREIVVEIEKVHLIRRRAKTNLFFCVDCKRETDFISPDEAAALFMTDTGRILHFISANKCHFQSRANDVACICLAAFLEAVGSKIDGSRIKLIGDKSK